MSFEIIPLNDTEIQEVTERPKLALGDHCGVVVNQKLKVDAEGNPVLSTRPKTLGCPVVLLTIKPLGDPEDLGTEVDVPIFHELPLPISVKLADGTVSKPNFADREMMALSNGLISAFVTDLERLPKAKSATKDREVYKATQSIAQELATRNRTLVGTKIYFTASENNGYVNYRGFRPALGDGKTLVPAEEMVA